jgi:hypothetical protein
MVVVLTFNTAQTEFWWNILLECVHLEDRKVDGRIYVLMLMTMKVEEVEIILEAW